MNAPLPGHELSRRYHLLLAQSDADRRDLEAQIGTMPLAEYNRRWQAIAEWRGTLRKMWEREHNTDRDV